MRFLLKNIVEISLKAFTQFYKIFLSGIKLIRTLNEYLIELNSGFSHAQFRNIQAFHTQYFFFGISVF
jgi:hypothetical protein